MSAPGRLKPDSWPQGKVALSFDVDNASATLSRSNLNSEVISRGEYGAREYEPGSDLFIVYTEARNTRVGGFPELVNRGFAIKLTRLIRF